MSTTVQKLQLLIMSNIAAEMLPKNKIPTLHICRGTWFNVVVCEHELQLVDILISEESKSLSSDMDFAVFLLLRGCFFCSHTNIKRSAPFSTSDQLLIRIDSASANVHNHIFSLTPPNKLNQY